MAETAPPLCADPDRALILFRLCRPWLAVWRGFVHRARLIHAKRDRGAWLVGGEAAAVMVLAALAIPLPL